jgi:hypothetical protein
MPGGVLQTERRHKYRAQRTECANGHSHPSKAEARRCGELHLLQRLGEIRMLEREVPFPFRVDGKTIFTYRADFAYFEGDCRVVEDVKGVLTPIYKLKKKLIEAQYPGVKIVEVR